LFLKNEIKIVAAALSGEQISTNLCPLIKIGPDELPLQALCIAYECLFGINCKLTIPQSAGNNPCFVFFGRFCCCASALRKKQEGRKKSF